MLGQEVGGGLGKGGHLSQSLTLQKGSQVLQETAPPGMGSVAPQSRIPEGICRD